MNSWPAGLLSVRRRGKGQGGPDYRGAAGECSQGRNSPRASRNASSARGRGFSTSVRTRAAVMLSRASTTRRRLNLRRVGSGRDCGVRASGLQDRGLDRRRGIPGAGGIRITPPGRPPRSSARASACSPSCGGIPPPSGSRRPGCGPVSLAQGETEAPGGLEHLPQAVLRGRANPAGASPSGRPATSAREGVRRRR
jgi:hypothetical protein